ncbi:MAG: tetratricopeptide repeat protein [Bacteroidaceae bacterium]|nr:tetratricopeptide repeat protein [Bacteroidaceae bacterium]
MRIRNLLLLVLLCALSSCSMLRSIGISTKQQNDVTDYDAFRRDYFYYEALNQMQQENYDGAFQLLNYCNKIDSTSAAVNYNLAQLYILLNDKTRTTELLNLAIKQDPDNYWYYNLTGLYYAQNHKPYQAISLFEEMMNRFPTRTEVLMTLAELYDETRQYDKELQMLNRYAVIEDVWDELSSQRFLCYLRMGEVDSAYYEIEDNFGDMVQILSQSVNNLAGVNLVLRLCETALKNNPKLSAAYYYSAISMFQIQDEENSLAILADGIEMVPDSIGKASLYGLRSELYYTMGRPDDAFLDYDSTLLYNPNDIGVQNNYAYYLSVAGKDLEKALRMSANTLKAEPNNPTYLDTYAWILFKMKRYQEAKEYIIRALNEEGEKSADVVEHYGDILYMCGDIEGAVENWHKAVRLNSTSPTLQEKINQEKYIE